MLNRGFLVQAGVFIIPGWKDLLRGLRFTSFTCIQSEKPEYRANTNNLFSFSWKLLAPIPFVGSSCIVFSHTKKISSITHQWHWGSHQLSKYHSPSSQSSLLSLLCTVNRMRRIGAIYRTFICITYSSQIFLVWIQSLEWKGWMTLHCWDQHPLYNVLQQTINMATTTPTVAFS